MIEFLQSQYDIIILLVALLLLIWGIYNKIKFLCLEKASEMVAQAEEHSELSGQEKFALVVLWINDCLPAFFRNNLVQIIIKKLIEFAYDTSFKFMQKYVKRKTGKDISQIISVIKSEIEESQEDKK